jgi:hypothetical protein
VPFSALLCARAVPQHAAAPAPAPTPPPARPPQVRARLLGGAGLPSLHEQPPGGLQRPPHRLPLLLRQQAAPVRPGAGAPRPLQQPALAAPRQPGCQAAPRRPEAALKGRAADGRARGGNWPRTQAPACPPLPAPAGSPAGQPRRGGGAHRGALHAAAARRHQGLAARARRLLRAAVGGLLGVLGGWGWGAAVVLWVAAGLLGCWAAGLLGWPGAAHRPFWRQRCGPLRCGPAAARAAAQPPTLARRPAACLPLQAQHLCGREVRAAGGRDSARLHRAVRQPGVGGADGRGLQRGPGQRADLALRHGCACAPAVLGRPASAAALPAAAGAARGPPPPLPLASSRSAHARRPAGARAGQSVARSEVPLPMCPQACSRRAAWRTRLGRCWPPGRPSG